MTWHTDYVENKNMALHLKKVADPCSMGIMNGHLLWHQKTMAKALPYYTYALLLKMKLENVYIVSTFDWAHFHRGVGSLPAAADDATENDLLSCTAHRTIGLGAVLIVAIQVFNEVVLKTMRKH